LSGKVCLSAKTAVATEHPLASMAAIQVLRRGGNAFDAAVAASFVLGVVMPEMNGLGGDFFALAHEARTRRVHCLNASGWSSSASSVEQLEALGLDSTPFQGALSVVVPGFVKGLASFQERFGRLEFPELLRDSIEIAENGFAVTRLLASSIRRFGHLLPCSAAELLMPGGEGLGQGTVLKQKKLGRTLRAIRDEGPAALYDGWVADRIIAEVERSGGVLEPSDLKEFEPEWCPPITAEYRGKKVYEMPPNSMGATTLLILRYLEGIDLGRLKPNSAERVGETLKAVISAYAQKDRMLGDPRFVPFDLQRFLRGGRPRARSNPAPGDTTYFAISDAAGNIVSCIQSLYQQFGSNLFVEECGFFLNNRGSSFKLEGPNRLEPRKRPLHSLSTLLVEDEAGVRLATGSSAGDYRPQQHALLLTNLIDYRMPLEDAIDFPRFWWNGGANLMLERGFSRIGQLAYVKQLVRPPRYMGTAQGVEHLEDAKKSVCDVRGDGTPLGD